jgi:hypothetical protein
VFQPFCFTRVEKHLPIRASDKEHRLISQGFSPDPFYFSLTTATQEIEANAILFRLNYFAQTRSEPGILSHIEITLKHAVLHPLSIGFEDVVNFGSPFGSIVTLILMLLGFSQAALG